MTQSVSQGVLAYVGYDRGLAVPGRYPERVDIEVRDRVLEIIATADAARPRASQDLFEWAEETRAEIDVRFPELDKSASVVIRALISYEWR